MPLDHHDVDHLLDSIDNYKVVRDKWNKIEYDRDYFMGREMEDAVDQVSHALDEIITNRVYEIVEKVFRKVGELGNDVV